MDKQFVYNEKKANPTVIWLLFLFLGWSYGSLGKIGIQILYYITLGGAGIWTLIRLFTLNGAIRDYNKKIAMELGFDNSELVQLGLVK
ncbi:MAG: TM2 domain-containing protein [Bacteroidetes bacterium]|nr:TM2 domain-containing protein [Bacteroidota bacterium]